MFYIDVKKGPMLKKLLLAVSTILLIGIAVGWFLFLSPATSFDGKTTFFFIPTGSTNKAYILRSLADSSITRRTGIFDFVASKAGYWESVKPGRYQIRKGMNVIQMVRLLMSGSQSPVKMVINKIRTREEFARRTGGMLEADSAEIQSFMQSPDSLKQFGLDTNTAVTLIIPNTYSVFWNTSASRFFKRLYQESQTFWTEERLNKASGLGLTKEQVYILASIVEEESNKNDEKPIIASVYLNRLKKPMRLGADPTVKFALKDFGIKRILFKHIDASAGSPYNTYRHYGLPPGPICTPSIKTIDAVLNAADTDYLFFCAKADFSGYHAFASSEKDHYANARAYQKALDSLLIK